METKEKTSVTVGAKIKAPIEKVWKYWNEPEHIMKWNQASDDWHSPASRNDLRVGGEFSTTMAAKDGSFSFDFGGVYTEVDQHKKIAYTMGDGRKVVNVFTTNGNETQIESTFETESQNPVEMQRAGWQAIMDSFKKYTEAN